MPEILPQGCVLTNATGGYGLAISEYMIAYMFALQKKLPFYVKQKEEHLWKHGGPVRAITGSTVVCWGMGDIGSEFARRCKALGCKVIGIKRRPSVKPDYVDELYTADEVEKVLPRADVVAMSMPNTAATRKILNKDTLGLLKSDAIVINVGRGNAVDQEALCEALKSGRIAGAAIDVTEPEPLPEDHPLWDAPNLILTPHVSGGWSLPETLDRVVKICAENLSAFRRGDPLRNLIDFETGYKA
jgi:phosphoglycerate dehydrogenase-like enzyme